MCFSASASFSAAAVLTVIGVVTIKKTQSSPQVAFAAIPLLFAIQQLSEGLLWLALSDPTFARWEQFSTYTFLFFAQVVWPAWVPFAILKFETDDKHKRIARIFVAIGLLVSGYLAFCLIAFPVQAKIDGMHISYLQDYPARLASFGGAFYLAATVMPPFFSTARRMWLPGAAILVSYVMTTIFYEDYVVSVWCFFASIISVTVLAVIHAKKRNETMVISDQIN